MKASWNVACIFALSLPYYAICTTTYALNYTCSPPASQGGRGYCGPSFCENSASLAKDCIFTSKIIDYQSSISKLASKSCVQSTDARCSSAALRAVIVGGGIKAAYCNDAFLVIVSDGTPGFSTHLESIKNPPGAVSSDGSACVTRTVNPSYHVAKIPLYPTLLSTSDKNINNVNTNSYPAGPGDANGAYMSSTIKNTAATYGLPTRGDDLLCYCCIFRSTGSAELIIFTIAFTAMNKFISSHNLGAIGISVAGQEIFPVFNNLATLAPQKCEVDTCNEHVGGGGGQPHLHGDPFGSWCLYSARNYSRSDVHPPQIGWAFDGMSIYGRHLSVDNIGYTIILDDCGGHIHDIYGYHYHAQVITALTDNGAVKGQINGQPYYASTTGPYQCLKGDISKITNYFGGLLVSHTSVLPDTTTSMCSGTTNYYTASGIVLPYSTPSSASPSQAPTLGYSTYLIRQTINNIVLDTVTKKNEFSIIFIKSIASILQIDENKILITSIASTTRRLNDKDTEVEEINQYYIRPFLQLTGGAEIMYTVISQSSLTDTSTSLNLLSSATTINTALSILYPNSSVSTAIVLTETFSPSKSPVSSSSRMDIDTNIILSLSLISITMIFSFFYH